MECYVWKSPYSDIVHPHSSSHLCCLIPLLLPYVFLMVAMFIYHNAKSTHWCHYSLDLSHHFTCGCHAIGEGKSAAIEKGLVLLYCVLCCDGLKQLEMSRITHSMFEDWKGLTVQSSINDEWMSCHHCRSSMSWGTPKMCLHLPFTILASHPSW